MNTEDKAKLIPTPYLRAWRAFVGEMKNEKAYKEDKARYHRVLFKWSWTRFIYFIIIATTSYFMIWMIHPMNGDGIVFAMLLGQMGSHYCVEARL
jgi:hypothetical protein